MRKVIPFFVVCLLLGFTLNAQDLNWEALKTPIGNINQFKQIDNTLYGLTDGGKLISRDINGTEWTLNPNAPPSITSLAVIGNNLIVKTFISVPYGGLGSKRYVGFYTSTDNGQSFERTTSNSYQSPHLQHGGHTVVNDIIELDDEYIYKPSFDYISIYGQVTRFSISNSYTLDGINWYPVANLVFSAATTDGNGTFYLASSQTEYTQTVYKSTDPSFASYQNDSISLDVNPPNFDNYDYIKGFEYKDEKLYLASELALFISTNEGESWQGSGLPFYTGTPYRFRLESDGYFYCITQKQIFRIENPEANNWELFLESESNITGFTRLEDRFIYSIQGLGTYESTDDGNTWMNSQIQSTAGIPGTITCREDKLWQSSNGKTYTSELPDIDWTLYVSNNPGTFISEATGEDLPAENLSSYLTSSPTLHKGNLYQPTKLVDDERRTFGYGLAISYDNGISWQVLKEFFSKDYLIKFYWKENRFYVYTRRDGVFYSDDGGQNFERLNTEIADNLVDIGTVLEIDNKIFINTSAGFYQSSNNGLTWQIVLEEGLSHFFNSSLFSNDKWYFIQRSGAIAVSEDDGASWTQTRASYSDGLEDTRGNSFTNAFRYKNLLFLEANRSYYDDDLHSVMYEKYYYLSNDDGATLTRIDFPTGANTSFLFVKDDYFYITGNGFYRTHIDNLPLSESPNDESNCPETLSGYTYLGEHNNSKYFISTFKSSWDNANAEATTAGGHLVTLNDADENEFLRTKLQNNMIFIGINDGTNEGTFQWANGDAVGYTNFNEANSADGDYAVMNFWNGSWELDNNQVQRPYVIEVPCNGNNNLLPDLTVSNLKYEGSKNISQGDILSFTFDAANIGAGDVMGDFHIKFYISDNSFLDANDIEVGEIPTGNFVAGQVVENIGGAIQITDEVTVGSYFLITKIDAEEVITESDETNNTFVYANLFTVEEDGTGGGDFCGFIKRCEEGDSSCDEIFAQGFNPNLENVSLDANGNLVLEEETPNTNNFTYQVLTDESNLSLQATDNQGNTLWTQSYDLNLPNNFVNYRNVNARAFDNEIILVGSYRINDGGIIFFVIQTDLNGNEIRQRSDEPIFDEIQFTILDKATDGGYYIEDNNFGNRTVALRKIDANGNNAWTVNVAGDLVTSRHHFYGESPDGSAYFYGVSGRGNNFTRVVKLNPITGEEFWRQQLDILVDTNGFTSFQVINGGIPTEDGGIVVGYNFSTFGGGDIPSTGLGPIVGRLDSDGNPVWNRTLPNSMPLQPVLATSDGGFLLTSENYIAKISSDGDFTPTCTDNQEADLTISNMDYDTFNAFQNPESGDQIELSYAIENLGLLEVTETYTVNVSLRKRNDENAPLIFVGTYTHNNTPFGISEIFTETITLPDVPETTSYDFIFDVDADNVIVEADESNNRVVSPRGIFIEPFDPIELPDLTVQRFLFPSGNIVVNAGDLLSFSFDAANVGNVAVNGDFVIRFFLSNNGSLSDDDIEVGQIQTGNFGANQFINDIGIDVLIPANTAAGEFYYIMVQIDSDNQIEERSEFNNVISFPPPFTIENSTGGGGGGNNNCPDAVTGTTLLGDFDGHKYFISNEIDTWLNAQTAAAEAGGYLASISSLAENNFLIDVLNEQAFIGYNDADGDGTYTWDSGEAVSYTPAGMTLDNPFAHTNFWNGVWDFDGIYTQRKYVIELPCDNALQGQIAARYTNLATAKIAKLYPNPAQESIYLELESETEKDLNIHIINLLGEVVMSQKTSIYKGKNTLEMNIEKLPAGMYHLYIPTLENAKTQRFVKE